MKLKDFFSPCLFGHAANPLTIVRGKRMYQECRRCQAVIREVLPKLKLRVRPEGRAKVLSMQRKQA